MKILYVCHRFPYPPQRGGKIRPFNMIRHFSEQGHEVTVASLARDAAEASAAAGIAQHCKDYLVEIIGSTAAAARMVLRLPTLAPSSFGYFHSPTLARRIAERAAHERFDLVFAHCSSAAPYVRSIAGTPKILDFGDMDSQKWREYATHRRFPLSLGYWLEAVKLERAEAELGRDFDLLTCTTRAEWQTLEGYGVGRPTDWFPNGVDSQAFAPTDGTFDPNLIAFVGRMDYFPNQQAVFEFCDVVLPRLQQSIPAVRFSIIGADPPPHVRKLAERPGVEVTGSVPDVRPLVRQAAFTVAPLQIARGTQNKILESMALGVPVISSLAAAGGVDAIAGEHLLVAADAEQMTAHCTRLLGDSAERYRLSSAGRARVLSHHSWAASMRRLDGIVANAVDAHAERRASAA
jgi:sugar transferase (PEP-CTERM/EpsH1 system associated)